MNAGLVTQTVLGNFPLSYKFNLIVALIIGVGSAMSQLNMYLLIVVAGLFGMNLVLASRKVSVQKSNHWVIGGGLFSGIMGSGCASCGLPILSVFGLSGSVAILPFRGLELLILSIILLLISLVILIRKESAQNSCLI